MTPASRVSGRGKRAVLAHRHGRSTAEKQIARAPADDVPAELLHLRKLGGIVPAFAMELLLLVQVNAWTLDRGTDIESVLDDVHDHLQDGAAQPQGTRASHHEPRPAA